MTPTTASAGKGDDGMMGRGMIGAGDFCFSYVQELKSSKAHALKMA